MNYANAGNDKNCVIKGEVLSKQVKACPGSSRGIEGSSATWTEGEERRGRKVKTCFWQDVRSREEKKL